MKNKQNNIANQRLVALWAKWGGSEINNLLKNL